MSVCDPSRSTHPREASQNKPAGIIRGGASCRLPANEKESWSESRQGKESGRSSRASGWVLSPICSTVTRRRPQRTALCPADHKDSLSGQTSSSSSNNHLAADSLSVCSSTLLVYTAFLLSKRSFHSSIVTSLLCVWSLLRD